MYNGKDDRLHSFIIPLCLSLCSKAKLQWNNGRDEAELHDIRTKGAPQKQHSLVDLKEQGVYDMVVEHKIVASGEHTYVMSCQMSME